MPLKSLFLAIMTLEFFLGLPSMADTGLSRQVQLHPFSGSEKPLISFGEAYAKGSSLKNDEAFLAALNLNSAEVQNSDTLFHGRAGYTVSLPLTTLSAAFFENIPEIQKLVGPSAKVQAVSNSPFQYSLTTSVFFGLVTLKSVQSVRVLDKQDYGQDPELLKIVSDLNRRDRLPERIILQQSQFLPNAYARQGFILTFLFSSPSGTDIESISGVLFKNIPPLIGRSFIQQTTEDDLTGYAQRLEAEAPL